jgi:hypothetical protein
VAVVDDEPGACGALVDGRHVHLLAVPRHDPSGAAKQYEGDGWEQRVGGIRVKQIGGSWALDPRRGRRRVYRRPRTDPITEGEVGVGRRLSGTGCSLASEVRSLTHGPEAHMSAMDGASVKETTSLSPCALLPVRSELHARLRQSWNSFSYRRLGSMRPRRTNPCESGEQASR